MAEILEGKVLASAPIMGEDGPEGVLLRIEWGDSDVIEWTILRGPAALALLVTPGPAVKRARTPRGAGGSTNGVVKECFKCTQCSHKPFSRRGNAVAHLKMVHRVAEKDAHHHLQSC